MKQDAVYRGARVMIASGGLILLVATAQAQPLPGSLLPPVHPACVSSLFGVRRAPGPDATGFHNGIDLPAPAGGAVYAAASGQIESIHRRGPGGLELSIRHKGPGGDFITLYAHLGAVAPAFAAGRITVAAGDRIARVGRSGITYGTHLYFEVLAHGHPIDPVGPLTISPCSETPPRIENRAVHG